MSVKSVTVPLCSFISISVQSVLGHSKDIAAKPQTGKKMKGGTILSEALYMLFFTPFLPIIFAWRSQQWCTIIIFSLCKTVMLPGDLCSFAIRAIKNAKNLPSEKYLQVREKTVFIKILSAMLRPNFRQVTSLSHLLVHIHSFSQRREKVSF